jgi:TPR repeat protein
VPSSEAAIATALERAATDCASAARRLGVAYAKGELGLAQDERRAAALYKAAAARGDAAAQHNLGLMYMSGGKAPKALKWFRAAAAQDHAPSVYNLATAYAFGTGVPRDAAEASSLYRRAAMLGSAEAAYALGRLEPDAVAAREYFVVAARRGHRLAAAALRGEG